MAKASLSGKAALRKQALQRMCLDGEGRLTRDAKVVLKYLSNECNGDGQITFPRHAVGVDAQGRAIHGDIDQTAMVRMAGRREVFDMLVRMLTITLEQRQNLEE